ncbi:cytochrome P450 [Xylariales sp. PMI_506]|nr:cytochrome P450 [Xylariales sp. PMI_506]
MSEIHSLTGLFNLARQSSIAVSILISLCSLAVWRLFLSPIRDIPGPKWASLTRLWHMNEIWGGHQNITILELHKKHGHFVRIGPNEVSVTHPEVIKKMILTPQLKGHWYKMMRFPDWRFRTPMSVLEPRAKVELSKQLASAYAMTNVIKSEEHITVQIEGLLQWLDKYANSHEPMDLAKFFTFTAFDIVGEVVFSKPFGFLEKGIDIDNCIAQTLQFECYISIAAFAQWLHNLLVANPVVTWLGIMPTNYLAKTSNLALEARKKNQEARFDFVAHWLKAHEKSPDKLSYRDLQSAVMANVGAGSDTVSCALQSTVYHMIRHPNAWQRAREEIDRARDQEGICIDRVISYTDAQKLPYLQACFKEALRIFHPVSMGTPRVVPKGGISIGGRFFTAGTTLSLNTFSMNLSKDVWGPDAQEYKPERWMVEDPSALERNFLPFSGGIGACVGQHLAKVEIFKILTTIIRDYDIEQAQVGHEWKYHAYFTVVPGDWPVYIKKRAL